MGVAAQPRPRGVLLPHWQTSLAFIFSGAGQSITYSVAAVGSITEP